MTKATLKKAISRRSEQYQAILAMTGWTKQDNDRRNTITHNTTIANIHKVARPYVLLGSTEIVVATKCGVYYTKAI